MKVKGRTNRQIHTHNRNLSDAAMSTFLGMLKYKASWYGVQCVEIGKYEASTSVCAECGYHGEKLDTSIRKWTCPKCGAKLDRDTNAAKVILQKALAM